MKGYLKRRGDVEWSTLGRHRSWMGDGRHGVGQEKGGVRAEFTCSLKKIEEPVE